MSTRLETLLQMLQDDPNDAFIIFAVAKEYEKLNLTNKAIETYVQLRQDHPDYIGLYYHLGKLYEEIGNTTSALDTYEEGIQVGKKQSDFHAISELNNAKVNLEMEL
jgi:tetratricopeptide (TPR) repeat protein